MCTWTRTRVLGSTLTLPGSSIDDVVFTLMFVLTVSWFVLLPDSLSYYVFVLYGILVLPCLPFVFLDWCICIFGVFVFVGVLYFVVVFK